MQTDIKELSKILHTKHGKSEELYKDVIGFVFKDVSRLVKNPTNLIVKLKGLGIWYLRKLRMELYILSFAYTPPKEDSSEVILKNYQDRLDRLKLFKERLVDYERYVTLKKEIRLKRNETQYILPKKQES